MPRFSIQEHHTSPLHWDLMLERSGSLATWSLPSPPPPGPFSLDALQHFDHRLIYLTFEGEIAGGRGWTRLWDSGECEATFSSDLVVATLQGAKLQGRFTLEFSKPGKRALWLFRRSP